MFFIKTFIISLLLVFTINNHSLSQENFSCLNNDEISAFSIRALQTNYMVAALSCDGVKNDYNVFVEKFQNTFNENGEILKNYFARCYGKKANSNLDKFITKLANDISFLSLENPVSFYSKEKSRG